MHKHKLLKKIDSIVRQTCPDLPEDTWQIANIKNETVVIEVRSAIWSQRLQFEKNNIALQLAHACFISRVLAQSMHVPRRRLRDSH